MLPENWMELTAERLQEGGIFLMVQDNPMTIGWAQLGVIWGRPTATVYVRHSRHTHALLENSQYFTLSVPEKGAMKEALRFCGTRSGRDVNKLEAQNLTLLPSRFDGQGGLAGCRFHIECRILHRTEIPMENIEEPAILSRYYPKGDQHTQYIAEILGVYEE